MDIQYLSKLVPEFRLNPASGKRWALAQPFEFAVDGRVFVAPEGFWTDFASVPRVFWPLVSPYDLGVGPVVHDFGYFVGYESKHFWDLVFKACMEKDGVRSWRRHAAYAAVDLFGWSAWKRYRQSVNTKRLLRGATSRKLEVVPWAAADRPTRSSRLMMAVDEVLWKAQVEGLTATTH